MTDPKTRTPAEPLLSKEKVKETLVAISSYEGYDGHRLFLNGWNGDTCEKWSDAVKWTQSFYEEDRTKLLSRIASLEAAAQVAVDALKKTPHTATCTYRQQFAGVGFPCLCGKDAALSQYSSLGIKPTER